MLPVRQTANASAPQGRMLVWQRRDARGLRVEPGHAALDVSRQPGERLVHRRLELAAESDRVLAAVGHRRRVDRLAVHAGAVLEAGERRARLAHGE